MTKEKLVSGSTATPPLSSRSQLSWPCGPPKVMKTPRSSKHSLRIRCSPLCHPERSRISYLTALTSDHLCGSPQREPHALDRSRHLDRKSGEAEGSEVLQALSGNVFGPLSQHLLSREKSKGAPGLAFETWDPCNRSRRETLTPPQGRVCGLL
jgi:hypothetical protein